MMNFAGILDFAWCHSFKQIATCGDKEIMKFVLTIMNFV